MYMNMCINSHFFVTHSRPRPVIGVVLISSCGHAQVHGDNLQFQPINGQSQSPATTSTSSSSPVSSQGFNQQPPVNTPVSTQSNIQTQHSPLDGQRFQQIVSGSERFALELFSVSSAKYNTTIDFLILTYHLIYTEDSRCARVRQIQLYPVTVLHLVLAGADRRGSSWKHVPGTATRPGHL